jgi:uncharacterized cupin superfamily protein
VSLNLFDDVWKDGEERAGYASRERRVAEELGAALWGATMYELGPGERICPYHWQVGEEEWLLVVAGAPTLRVPGGERVLREWDVAVFPRGPEGAHEVRNGGDATARVLLLSSLSDPEISVYPDSGKIGAGGGWSRSDDVRVGLRNRPEANLDYFDGEA